MTTMVNKKMNEAFKTISSALFGHVIGYSKWFAKVQDLHPSYLFLFAFFFTVPQTAELQNNESFAEAIFLKRRQTAHQAD